MAAHPDDELLGVGGTLLRHKDAGDEVTVALCYPCRVQDPVILDAVKATGFRYDWYVTDIDAHVAEHKPDIVYTHWRGDLNKEHRELHERVLVACRPQSGVKAIYAFDTASSTEWGVEPFVPDTFVDIEATLDRKLRALEAYASELRQPPHPRSLGGLEVRAAFWGQRIGADWAEAFVTVRRAW